MKKITLFLLLQFSVLSFAQSLDTTFNPTDVGFGMGDGPSGMVSKSIIQPDGKILITGLFSGYNGALARFIARLNTDGSLDTSFSAGVGPNSIVDEIALQSDGKIIIVGNFTLFNNVLVNRIVRLNADGSLDTSFNGGAGASIGANSRVSKIFVQPDGKIIIAGSFTSYNGIPVHDLARLNVDGSLDTGFNAGSSTNSTISSVSMQSDGKIIIGGSFTSYNGVAVNGITRLNTDGSLDTTFVWAGLINSVRSVLIQTDGKIIIGGQIPPGTSKNGIARLNADGSLDTSFDVGSGFNGYLEALAIQSDGKIILAGGGITQCNGSYVGNVFRLNVDGSLDTGFSTGSGLNGYVYSVSIQSDGKIIAGGDFTVYNGILTKRLTRINADGSLDGSFNSVPLTGVNGEVYCSALQSDGKIIIGGYFTGYNGTPRNNIARLNPNGSLDTSFNAGAIGVDGQIWDIKIQLDGKILVAGNFWYYDNIVRGHLLRLNNDGSLDESFDTGVGADGEVFKMAIQADGKIVIVGPFSSYNDTTSNEIARLNADGSLDMSFDSGTGVSGSYADTAILQSDGKIIVGGNLVSYNDVSVKGVIRLNSNGTLDTSFNSAFGSEEIPYSDVSAIAIQSDGKIIIGGPSVVARLNQDGSLDTGFSTASDAVNVTSISLQSDGKVILGGDFDSFITRLNSDGTKDVSFNVGTGANNVVNSISVQSDGGIIIVGRFRSYNGIGRNRVARINGTDVSNPGPIATTQTFCGGATVANLTAEGTDVKWYNVAVAGNPLPLNTVLVNTNYYFSVNGIESIRTTVPVNILPNAVAGSISGAGTICSGSSKTLILSASHVGTVQWQSSTISSTAGFSNIEGATGNTYLASALTTTAYYQAVVTNGCSSATTLPIPLVVTPSVAVAGHIESSDEDGYVCKYVAATSTGVQVTNSTRLTLKDNAGLILWQKSTNGGATWGNVTGTTTSLIVNNLTATAMFRAKSSTSGMCSSSYKYTDPITINVYPAAVAGILTADSNGYTNVSKVCVGNDITFTSTKQVGNIEWQTSTVSATGPWTTVGENSTTYTITNVQGANNSRIYVKTITSGNAACPFNPKPSAVRAITVTGVPVPGTLSGGKAVCSLGGGTLKLTGAIGMIQWMYSTDEGATYSNVATGNNSAFATTSSGKSTSLIVTGVTATTHFRATVTNGNCSGLYSNVQAFTLGQAVVAGTIRGADKVCYGTGTTLELDGAVGAIQWEKASYNQITNTYGTWAPVFGKTTATLLTGNLSSSYGYKATVTVCTSSSTIHNVIVDKAYARTVTCNVTVPSGTSTATTGTSRPLPDDFSVAKVLTVSAGSWGSISWERSIDGSTYTTIPGASGTQYTIKEAASSSTGAVNYYRARFTTSCSPEVTSAAVRLYYKGTGGIAKFATEETAVANVGKSFLTVAAYPNPYSESFKLSVSTSSDSKVGIMVYDMLGKQLEQREVMPSEVSELNIGTHYPTGIYNVIFTQDDEIKTLRVIKQ